jgi:signal transduction histidine kinase
MGQQQPDSLVKLSSTLSDKVERCRIFLELSRLYQKSDTVQSKSYRQKALALAAQLNDDQQKLKAHLVFAKHYLTTRYFDEARTHTDKALSLVKPNGNNEDLATIRYYSGCIHLSQGNSRKALDEFIQSYRLAEASGDSDLQAHVNSSFGVIYQQQNQLDSALVYYKKSFDYFERTTGNTEYSMTGSQNIGNILLAKGSFTEGQTYLKRALDLAKQRKDINAEMIVLGNIANGYEREGKLELAEFYAAELVKDAEKTGFLMQELYGKTLLSTIKLDEKKYDEAIRQAKEALVLAEQVKMTSFMVPLYEMLVAGHEQKGDYQHAYHYKNKLVHIKDSLSAIENTTYIEEIKQKYNLQKKNQELLLKTELIQQIQKTGKQKTVIIISLLVLGVSGLVSAFLFFQRRKIKEELARKNMALENQNKHFEAFINGQEQERKRIASDLHDGLAQNLVMLKMGIRNFNMPDQAQQEKLNYYSAELDTMIEETRRISHNMMPGVLVDLGLLKALKSLVADLNTNHQDLQTTLSVSEPFIKLPPEVEIQLYRIIQELLNNVIKHSGATACDIRLSAGSEGIRIGLKDNGQGFEKKHAKTGIGLQNIGSRVNSLNGTFTIDSAPGKGTLVSILIGSINTSWKA